MKQDNKPRKDWSERADCAQKDLYRLFWNDDLNMFNNIYPYECEEDNKVFNYWWLAHGIEVFVDGYERSGQQDYLTKGGQLYEAIKDRNKGTMINDYYDDMLWMAIGLLRMYENNRNDQYKEEVFTLWEDIKKGWNNHYDGGIAWRKEQLDYKNTPANAPAVILAARLYQLFGQKEDYKWALDIYEWLENHLIDKETGIVWDGINRLGDGKIDKEWTFTYCQGVYIGACVELYKISRENKYLERAMRTAKATIQRMGNKDTYALPDEGKGDGGLFKGIFIRYLGNLIDLKLEDDLLDVLQVYGKVLLERGNDENGLFSKTWFVRPEKREDLSVQLSGVILLEQLAILEKGGRYECSL